MSLSNTDLMFLASIDSAGERPIGVFGLGVILYTCRNCCSTLSVGVPGASFRALFKVSINLSAWPFDLGWYCGVVICFTLYVSQNCLNSLDVNCVPLSVTTQSNWPKLANSSCWNPIVQLVVGLLHFRTSVHLVWLSMSMRYYWSSKVPEKSTWILCHGWTVFGHGLHVFADALAASAHPLHESTMSAMSLSMFGQ